MKVAIVIHSIPNLVSEGAAKEPLLFIKELEKQRISLKIIIIYDNQNFSANQDPKKFLKAFKKHEIEIYYPPKTNFLRSVLNFFGRLFINTPDKYYVGKKIKDKIETSIKSYNPDFILNMYNYPCSSNYSIKNIPRYNYLTIPVHMVEEIRFKNFFRDLSIFDTFKIINSFFYKITVKQIYNNIYNNCRIGFLAAPDTKKFYKKFKIKKIIIPKNITINENQKYFPFVNKKQTLLLVGNLRATFTREGMYELTDNLIDELIELRKQIKFNVRIVGHFKPTNKMKKKLNFPWVKFTGWVKDINNEYKYANALLVTNTSPLGTRMRILNGMAAGLPIITYQNNVIYNKEFINKKNILIAKNKSEMLKHIKTTLVNKKLCKKISFNAHKVIKDHYDPYVITKSILSEILKDYKKL